MSATKKQQLHCSELLWEQSQEEIKKLQEENKKLKEDKNAHLQLGLSLQEENKKLKEEIKQLEGNLQFQDNLEKTIIDNIISKYNLNKNEVYRLVSWNFSVAELQLSLESQES
jgi:hypothetical protein